MKNIEKVIFNIFKENDYKNIKVYLNNIEEIRKLINNVNYILLRVGFED